jgi:CBS domain-containing protein
MFELTGQLTFLVPTLLATVLAVPVASLFNESFFAETSQLRGIPEIKPMRKKLSHQLIASDLMRKNVDYFPKISTVGKGLELKKGVFRSYYPIVNNDTDRVLLGYIKSDKIKVIIDQYKNTPNAEIIFKIKKKLEDDDETKELFVKSYRGIEIQYDASPLVILINTPLIRILYLFSILGLSHAYVLDKGERDSTNFFKGSLAGVITKKDLIKFNL